MIITSKIQRTHKLKLECSFSGSGMANSYPNEVNTANIVKIDTNKPRIPKSEGE